MSVALESDVVQLKNAKQRKGEIARQFKDVVKGSPEHSELLLAMQAITDEIKRLEHAQNEKKVAPLEIRESHDHLPNENCATRNKQPPLYVIPPDRLWGEMLTLRELRTGEMPLWQDFLQRQQNLSVYHLPVWSTIIQQVFNHPSGVFAAFSSSGDLLGGIPITYFASRLFGRFGVSVPYFNYGGVVSTYFDVAQQLIAGAAEVCDRKNLSHIEVRTLQAGLAKNVSCKKVSMILTLPSTQEELDKNLGTKVRAQIKKALDYAPIIKIGKLELLEDFYRVFAENMRDLGTPVYSRRWFSTILQNDEINAHLAVVYMASKPVATGFLIGHNGMLEIPWASTIKSANPKNANMWFYRQILGFAIDQGFGFFDFGRSTKDAGTYKFKKQWGAEPHEHFWYYSLGANGSMPGLNPDNPKYKLLIAVWQRLPVWLTKIIGPPIVGNIP